MNIKFYGHNCFVLSSKKTCLIIDPWFSNEGAFFGSWFQWPLNHQLLKTLIKEIEGKKVFLYISHEHQDHFDIKTLKKIKPLIYKSIIPSYFDKYLKNQVEKIGYPVIELKDSEMYFFTSNDFIQLFTIDTGVNHDSMALIKINNKTFLNQNDCKIFDRLNYFSSKQINYYAVQFSGATWHPICYEIDKKKKIQISKQKVNSKLIAIKNALKILQPEFYFPSAGPAIFPFLKQNFSLGNENIFIHQTELDMFLSKQNIKLTYLKPGEKFNSLKKTTPIPAPTKSQLQIIKSSLKCKYLIDKNLLDIKLLENAIKYRLNEIKGLIFESCPILIFKWGFKGLEINLNTKQVSRINFKNYNYPNKFVEISGSKKYFSLMANPKYRWQDIYLSLRAKVKREPDIFNTFINIFLFSDISNIRKGFETTLNIDNEKIIIINPNNGKNYEINRYCPHNGADLKNARFDNKGHLICPRHSWLFDLDKKGVCLSSNVTINAREIENSITLCESVNIHLTKNVSD